jgi:hypothetical protein
MTSKDMLVNMQHLVPEVQEIFFSVEIIGNQEDF